MIQLARYVCFSVAFCGFMVYANRLAAQEIDPPAFETTSDVFLLDPPPLGVGPWEFDTLQHRIRVSVVARGLTRPFGMEFLPNGDMLVVELPGRLRRISGDILDSEIITGVPEVHTVGTAGLKDVVIHPQFEQTGWVYLVYTKPDTEGRSTTAIARGRLEGNALLDVSDIFIADALVDRDADTGSRIMFDHEGFLYVTIGDRFQLDLVQTGDNHFGKVLRLHGDGSIPADNPFIDTPGYSPEIYTLGHRNAQGLAVNPWTGEIWSNEHGPMGGDELNKLIPGGNFGWPLATFGKQYGGSEMTDTPVRAEMESPVLFWVPAIAPTGLMFYTSPEFSHWRGNIFMGAMGVNARGHLRRIVFDGNGFEIGQELLLEDLHQRIRDVQEGPDGFLYVLTDDPNNADGAVLRIEPVK